ncbi:MAG: ABC transporter ATP-binding protein [Deltaproteobacteria bacterium]|nr:ABC transporter ATP-binding protein [Deltaproteobacteria bacterium]NCP03750.1 ABC transporter ATP-binding protein [Deltaproteobacteria bacterium]NCP77782.1 ABC transporter ATP-binding protein [Desulfuromonadales bacterium]
MARIELKNLAHAYQPNPKDAADYALKPIDHVWQDGLAYALLGPSGCGKTTLLNIISGLLKPSQGQILFDGTDVTTRAPQERNIAQVFQFPVIYDTMSVYNNLAFPLRNRKVAETNIRSRVEEIAEMLDLSADLEKRAANLSADAKQKISLGRGLVRSDVAAILFDEPLTVIDPHLKLLLRRKLKQIHARFKLTMVYVTHDQLEALTFADRVVVMNDGQVLQIGTPQELFETPRHTFVGFFIGSPGMNFLACRVSRGKALVGSAQIALAADYGALEGDFELGIRPEFLKLHATQTLGSLPVKICENENLGSCKIITVQLADQQLKVRLGEEETPPTTAGFLEFPAAWIRLYAKGLLVEPEPRKQPTQEVPP